MILTNDPVASEKIRLAEGEYPTRGFEKNTRWFYNQRNEKSPVIFEYGTYILGCIIII